MVRVDIAVDRPDFGPEHSLERDAERVNQRHVEAALARRGSNLGADPPGADYHHPAASVEPCAERVRVLDAAQVENAFELGAGDGQPARLGAGCQEQPVVADSVAVVERQLAPGGIQADGCPAEPELDVLLGVKGARVYVHLLAIGLAA
jgi:hypothetical protein